MILITHHCQLRALFWVLLFVLLIPSFSFGKFVVLTFLGIPSERRKSRRVDRIESGIVAFR